MKADYNDVSGIADNSFGLERLVTFPGEDVSPVLKCSTTEVVLGHGLSLCSGHVLTSVAGKLRHGAPLRFSTETDSKYYSPSVGDNVVAVIEDKLGDFYILNIFTGGTATMSRLAFDGATKRNKPELKRGDVVYARVVLVDRNCDVELSCLAPVGPKKDWSSGEAVRPFLIILSKCKLMVRCFILVVCRFMENCQVVCWNVSL
jgi:exosome complex RNA-binding protein Rrp4